MTSAYVHAFDGLVGLGVNIVAVCLGEAAWQGPFLGGWSLWDQGKKGVGEDRRGMGVLCCNHRE